MTSKPAEGAKKKRTPTPLELRCKRVDAPLGGTDTECHIHGLGALVILESNLDRAEHVGIQAYLGSYLSRFPVYDRVTRSDWRYGRPLLAEFAATLSRAMKRCTTLDIFIFGHDNEGAWKQREPLHLFSRLCTGLTDSTQKSSFRSYIPIAQELRKKVRLVYNSACTYDSQWEHWLWYTRARGYLGHPGIASSPVFFHYFIQQWTEGVPLQRAVDVANAQTKRALMGVVGSIALKTLGARGVRYTRSQAIAATLVKREVTSPNLTIYSR